MGNEFHAFARIMAGDRHETLLAQVVSRNVPALAAAFLPDRGNHRHGTAAFCAAHPVTVIDWSFFHLSLHVGQVLVSVQNSEVN